MFCVYTCITGDYDQLKELAFTPSVDFLCFTNDPKLTSDTWKVIYLDIANCDHKRVKILFHEYLNDYTHSLWVDASFKWKQDITRHVINWTSEIHLILHRWGLEKEAEVIQHRQLTEANVDEMIKGFRAEGFPIQRTIHMGGFIYRKHSKKIEDFCKLWYSYTEICNRDQISLDYCLWKSGIKPKSELSSWVGNYCYRKHHNQKNPPSKVHYLMPFAMDKKVGDAYNEACEMVPDDDWICIMDQDILLDLGQYPQLIINNAIKNYPDTDLFGCYTNRVGLKWQLIDGELNNSPDILHHIAIAKERSKIKTCTVIDNTVGGYFMLFHKSVWKRHKFQEKLNDNGRFFDYDFSQQILRKGGTIRMIDGLYVFHRYRLGKYINDISHLN